MPRSDRDTSIEAPSTSFRFGERAREETRRAPVETPVNIVYPPMPFAVMMATPADLRDFAVGFSLTEGIVERVDEIRGVEIEERERGLGLLVTLAPEKMRRHLSRARNMAGRTGCGLCGIDDLSALPDFVGQPRAFSRPRLSAIRRAIGELGGRQPLNDATHAVHAAAWFSPEGECLAAREDVGRHNALDKLIGALALAGADPAAGFVVITSRCSFEMVEKAAVFGAGAIVAVSAPTSLAIERARARGMILMAVARADGVRCFTGEERIIDDLAGKDAGA